MLTCEELAKEIFLADNSRLTREQAEREWAEFQGPDITEYAHNIAAGLMPLLADIWDSGFFDGKRQDNEGDDGPKFTNPYRKATP